ncbi:MAG: dockerin type I repeat-containing protein [bacterium]
MKTLLVPFLICVLLVAAPLCAQSHLIIGWNDLGMHCSNKDFSKLVVLPPYNNIRAQVIQVGDAENLPVVVTTDLQVTYEIPGNTYSVGKTNFWDYEDQLFGVSLPDNIGLTGEGLTGTMTAHENYFHVEGVPITPYVDADLVNEDPFQLGLLKVYDQSMQLLATTQPVVPVSNEISCVGSGCHTSEQQILNEHDDEGGFDPNNTPILCATCHASNALGMAGNPELPSLSEAIHKKHGGITNDCYKCHPGPETQCLRDVMKAEHGFVCQTCHGSVTQVGESISDGREPWFEEPSCGAVQCHGANYAEEPGKLFRESRGHGGLFCSACHGEPHAIVPSEVDRDNVQNIALQGYAGTLDKCEVCHGVVPAGAGPHGIQGPSACSCGDANSDGVANITDAVFLIAFIFSGGPAPSPISCGDANCDGAANITDAVYVIQYIFNNGPSPCDTNNDGTPDC